ncbi:MAG: hypothetical protein ACSHXK_10765 [Oceanococcus sp.]
MTSNFVEKLNVNATPTSFGPAVIDCEIALAPESLDLIQCGVSALWQRIAATCGPQKVQSLLLSYDVHPTPDGPVLIEVNTNAGGILSSMQAAKQVNDCCPDAEQLFSQHRLLSLFQRDLLGTSEGTRNVAIVDDNVATQPLLGEMTQLAALFQSDGHNVRVIDAAELSYTDGRLIHKDWPIDRVYWRSTDFRLEVAEHAPIRQALQDGAISLAPSPQAYGAIADKSRLLSWSLDPVLAVNEEGLKFRIAETHRLSSRPLDEWYAERAQWVFKPGEGYGSRGVYVGKRISRKKLASLDPKIYVVQRYAPHPNISRGGEPWKYDLRFYADQGEIIGVSARVFQGQVVGLSASGSGFSPVRIGTSCCIVGALQRHSEKSKSASG